VGANLSVAAFSFLSHRSFLAHGVADTEILPIVGDPMALRGIDPWQIHLAEDFVLS
jgi:hypothetical protein